MVQYRIADFLSHEHAQPVHAFPQIDGGHLGTEAFFQYADARSRLDFAWSSNSPDGH